MKFFTSFLTLILFVALCSAQGPVTVIDAETLNNDGVVDVVQLLNQGDNIIGLSLGLGATIGKNKFDDDNTRKPSEISFSSGINYETMVNDHLAVGGFAEYSVDLNKNKESDTKWTTNTFIAGPMATCYKPCGDLEQGGLFTMGMIGAGFETNSYKFDGDKQKDPVNAIIAGQVDFGGYYQPTENWLITASMAMFGFHTQFMNMEEGESSPDMVETDFTLGFRDFIPSVSVRYVW